jgi:hypothetical protein
MLFLVSRSTTVNTSSSTIYNRKTPRFVLRRKQAGDVYDYVLLYTIISVEVDMVIDRQCGKQLAA